MMDDLLIELCVKLESISKFMDEKYEDLDNIDGLSLVELDDLVSSQLRKVKAKLLPKSEDDEPKNLRVENDELKSKLEDREDYIQFLEKRNQMYISALNDMAKIINQVNGPENYPWNYGSYAKYE